MNLALPRMGVSEPSASPPPQQELCTSPGDQALASRPSGPRPASPPSGPRALTPTLTDHGTDPPHATNSIKLPVCSAVSSSSAGFPASHTPSFCYRGSHRGSGSGYNGMGCHGVEKKRSVMIKLAQFKDFLFPRKSCSNSPPQ